MSYETDFEKVNADEEGEKPKNEKSLMNLGKTFAITVKSIIHVTLVIYAILLYNLSF